MDTPSHIISAPPDGAKASAPPHIPVLLEEVLHALRPQDGGVYVDATFGAGGYTRAILGAADCQVYAIDRDPAAIETATRMAQDYAGRLHVLAGRFGEMQSLLRAAGVDRVSGVVLDIGVSSMQLDTPARGFSFRHDGPLDMRMDMSGPSAADVVNTASEQALADIFYTYGEERAARRIAKRIVAARADGRIETTFHLRDIVHDVLPMHGGMKTDTATRSFQALRIFVNDELGELQAALDAAADLLAPDGVLAVVTFHSLEDGIVKAFLRKTSGREPAGSRHLPAVAVAAPVFALDKSGGVKPSAAEVARNPRARSARLRWARRLASDGKGGAHA